MMAVTRVLVIDDEGLMRDFVQEALSRAGYDVVTASNGEEGLRTVDKSQFHVVVTDLKMPGMDGLEVLKEIQERDPAVSVIVMTAYATVETAVQALKGGAADYIMKPFTPDEIEVVVEKAIYQQRLQDENRYLKSELDQVSGFGEIIGSGSAMESVYEQIKKVAPSPSTVLIQGESGTGKELVARAIHRASPRRDHPFIKVNCAALSAGLLESELFGHEKGAFTGAFQRKIGRFELADGGSLLLDEVTEIPLDLQAKLLRVLQEREFERVGGNRTIRIDTRIIGTTNRNLDEAVSEGKLREDLFFRLNVIPITLPPLRRRKEDIPKLLEHFTTRFAKENKKRIVRIEDEAVEMLRAYDWPGNVRELSNVIERAVVLTSSDSLSCSDFTLAPISPQPDGDGAVLLTVGCSLDEAEKHLICKTIEKAPTKAEAARILNISVRTLRNKLNEYARKGNQETFAETREKGPEQPQKSFGKSQATD